MQDAQSSLITGSNRYKVIAPGLPRGSIRRPRLDQMLTELFETYSVVEIVAAAGSGKTVQAQLYAAICPQELVWLTLDRSDRSAPALVMDLATALSPIVDNAVSTAHTALRSHDTAEEAAAVLASSIGDNQCLLVIDECQQIAAAPATASALDTFLAHVPEQTQVLLLARQELPWPLQKRYIYGQLAQIDERALNLTADEIAEYIDQCGGAQRSYEQILAFTGGWAAGVAFASRFGLSEYANLNDLSSYFGKLVLDNLPQAEQQFLLETSVAEVVTRELVAALCGQEGELLWSSVSARHLPATTVTKSTIKYHSIFRSFLRARLADTQPKRRRELDLAYARHLAASRQFEESTEVLLSLGLIDEAIETAQHALVGLLARADWTVLSRWLENFGEERVKADPLLVGAIIRTSFGMREFERTPLLIRRFEREGRLREAIEQDPSLLATAALALQARPQEAIGLLSKYIGDSRADVIRYMINALTASQPSALPNDRRIADVERSLSWGLFLQGRLRDLARLGSSDENMPLLNPNIVLASAFKDDTEEAVRLWRRVPYEIRDRPQSHFVEAMVELTRGDLDRAGHLLRTALADSQRSGFGMYPVYEIFIGCIHLLERDVDIAIDVLLPVLDDMSDLGHVAYAEMAQCFLGLAYLMKGRLSEAQLMLRDSSASMSQSQRRLLLPMAAAALSEVEAQLHNDEAAAEAASLAYHASQLTGSLWSLIRVVRLFPDIQQRESSRNPRDPRWRRLLAAPSTRPMKPAHTSNGEMTLLLQPFGRDRDIFINGEPTGIGRVKMLELVACLVLHPRGIDRGVLQQKLFPDADQKSGGNHFRQIAHKLRHGTGVALERRGNLVVVPESITLMANDIESERLLQNASSATGEERRQRLMEGLALVDGAYLERSMLGWVEERRSYLNLIYEEARLELARLHLELGDLAEAREVCESVLEVNRYSEPAYRVLVQIEQRMGSESSALAVYRRATEALAELGLEPGDARRLFRAEGALGAAGGR
jgi:LuxR family maltose regulon positive regulatory protein